MSTRCNLIVKDKYDSIQLYRHSDGYPDGKHGIIKALQEAKEFAWPLPRMEAADFSAAIVRAWKQHAGNIYIDGEANGIKSPPLHGDIQYLYTIEPDEKAGRWKVTCHAISFGEGEEPEVFDLLFTGYIGDEMPERTE